MYFAITQLSDLVGHVQMASSFARKLHMTQISAQL